MSTTGRARSVRYDRYGGASIVGGFKRYEDMNFGECAEADDQAAELAREYRIAQRARYARYGGF